MSRAERRLGSEEWVVVLAHGPATAALTDHTRTVLRLRRAVPLAALFIFVVGLLGLLGIFTHNPYFTSIVPGQVPIKVNSSLCYVLLGAAFWLDAGRLEERRGLLRRRLACGLASLVVLVGVLSCVEIVFGWDLGIDQALYRVPPEEALASYRPGLMSPITATDMVLVGVALLVLDRLPGWASTLSFVSGLLGAFSLFDLLLAPGMFHAHISPPSTIALPVVACILLAARPERGIVRWLYDPLARTRAVSTVLFELSDAPWRRHWLVRYGLAVASVALATALTELLRVRFGLSAFGVLFYLQAIVLVLAVGTGPSLASVLLSALCMIYFLVEPRFELQIGDLGAAVALALFMVVASFATLLVSWAQTALISTYDYARTLIETSLDPLFAIDSDGRVQGVNQAAERTLGLPRRDLIGRELFERFTEPDQARRMLEDVLEYGSVRNHALTLRGVSGALVEVLCNATVLHAREGLADRVIVSARDVTERSHALQRLRTSEERYRQLFEAMDEGFCTLQVICDSDGAGADLMILDANPALLGPAKREDVIGKRTSELAPVPGRHWLDTYAKVATTGEPARGEAFEPSVGRWYDAHAFRIGAPEERKVAVLLNDITRRKEAEERAQKDREQLEISQANLTGLLNSVSDLIWSVDLDCRLVYFNDGLVAHMKSQYGTDLRVGAAPSDLMPAERAAGLYQLFQRALKGGPFTIDWGLADGVMELSISPILRDGKAIGVSVFGKNVTERIRAQQALRDSEEAFRTLAESVPQLVWIGTADGSNVYSNQRWVDYTGLSLAQSAGYGWNAPFHPDYTQQAADAWARAAESGDAYQISCPLRAADGSYRWFLIRGTPLQDAGGKIIRWFGTCTDIDELKKTQEELFVLNRELDERVKQRAGELLAANTLLEAILEHIPSVVSVKELPALRYVRINRAAEQLSRIGRADALGKTDRELFPPAITAVLERIDQQTIATGRMVEVPDARIPIKRGVRIFHLRTVPIGDANGQVRHLLCISDDVTESVAQNEARAHLAAIVSGSDDAIVSQTLEGIVTSWNPGAERLFGWSAAEMLGKSIWDVHAPREQDEEAVFIQRILAGQHVENFETVRIHKDGRPLDVSITLSPLRDPAGVIVGTSKIVHDISALKRIQRELVQAKENTEAVNRELEAFSYSIAHDLRAPLRAIDGFSAALLEDYADKFDEGGRKYLDLVREAAGRMGQLINDVLELSRIGRAELLRQPVDVSSMARVICERLREADPQRAVEIVIQDGIEAAGDPRLLSVVLENLLGNAWKFTGKTSAARIEVGARQDGGGPRVYFVRDNGAGFDMARTGKLFGLFQRLHSERDFPGTGVGLAIVQRIVHRHGGQVWAEGQVGHGASLFFTLEPQTHALEPLSAALGRLAPAERATG